MSVVDEHARVWGAAPVDPRSMGGQANFRPSTTPAPIAPIATPPQLGWPLRDLLSAKPKARLAKVAEVLAAPTSGMSLVLIGSSRHGSGVSTVAAMLAAACGQRSVILDPGAITTPAAASRLGTGAVGWSECRTSGSLGLASELPAVVVGGTSSWRPLTPIEQVQLLPTIGRARRVLIIECLPGPAGLIEVLAALPAAAPVRTLWVARAAEHDLLQAAGDLRRVTAAASRDVRRTAALVSTHLYPRTSRKDAAAAAAAADQVSGRIDVPHDPKLIAPLTKVNPNHPSARLLAAAALI